MRLPETLSFDARLDYVAESSQNARPAFLSILLSCVFVILTVFSTTDAALLANASLALLPDLSLDIPAASFFWVAPFLLLGLYVYLHLQMSGIGETLAELPRVFPDGTPLEKRAYPWMATNLLRMKGGWPSFRLEELVAIVLLWGVVPLTLTAVWVRYLPLRNWVLSGVHVALIVLCVWAAMRLFAQTVATMSRGRLRMRHPRSQPVGAGGVADRRHAGGRLGADRRRCQSRGRSPCWWPTSAMPAWRSPSCAARICAMPRPATPT